MRRFAQSALLAALLTLAGCSMAPVYQKPEPAVSAAFKESPVAVADGWKTAQPSEQLERGAWWTVFGDATLDGLEQQALAANQNLKIAAARVRQARAGTQAARAALFPSVDAGAGASRQRLSPVSQGLPANASVPVQTVWDAGLSASYEVDLFGRVRDNVSAAGADAERSEALLRSVQLALQADVAQNYFNLRELDAELDLYERTVALRQDALKLVQRRYDEGQTSELDLARANTELANARSDAMTVQRLRAAAEHALAVLLGHDPSAFTLPAMPLEPVNLAIPAGMPSALLERRPDIAAAERAMAAANARIGVAKSAFFPVLTLGASGGFEAATVGNLFNAASKTFMVGPALALPLFDGGRRKSNLESASAQYDIALADYRQHVLVAVQEVEDNLATLRVLQDQTRTQAEAVRSASRAAHLSKTQYTEGAVNYLDVIDADRGVLQARRQAMQLAGVQAVATVNLIRALGGGWSAAH